MPAVYNGAMTIGQTMPGLNAALNDAGSALVLLRDEVLVHLPCFLEAIAAMVELAALATAQFSAQIQIGVQFGIQLGLTPPTVYLNALIAAKLSLLASIELLLPELTLNVQLAAAIAAVLALEAELALIVGPFLSVTLMLEACSIALLATAATALGAIQRYQATAAKLQTFGAYALAYSGALSGLGSGFDALAIATGVSQTSQVVATIQLVSASDTAAVAAQAAVFDSPAPSKTNGEGDFSQAIPGVGSALIETGDALVTLRDEVFAHVPCINDSIDLLLKMKAAATADLDARIAAAIAVQAKLTLSLHDPIAYIKGLVEAVAGVELSVDPVVAIQAQVNANASLAASIQAKIDFILGLSAQITATLSDCYAASFAAAEAAQAPLNDYQSMASQLSTPGAYSFTYVGSLSGLGAALDLVTPATGLPGATAVKATLQLVRSSNPTAIAAQSALLLVF